MGRKSKLKRERNAIKAMEGENSPAADIVLSPKLKKILAVILIGFVFIIGAGLRLSDLDVPRRTPDEQVYFVQSKNIANMGPGAVRRLAAEYNADKGVWIYPPPTRVGYLYLYAAAMKLTNVFDIKIGAYISTFFSIAALLMFVLIGLRFFNPWITLGGLIFFIVSPMDLAIARRCWQDSMFAFAGLLLAYICCEIRANPKKKILYFLWILAGCWCMLIKESGAVLYALSVLWLIHTAAVKERSVKKTALMLLLGIAGATLAIAVISKSVGGLSMAVDIYRHVKEAMPTNQYAIDFQSGPWYRMFKGFWLLTPVGTLLCAAGIIFIFFKKGFSGMRMDIAVTRGLVLFMASFTFIAAITPYCQNLRYISVMYIPFYLMAGVGLSWAILAAHRMVKGNIFYFITAVLVILAVVGALGDYRIFDLMFVKNQVPDLSLGVVERSVQALKDIPSLN